MKKILVSLVVFMTIFAMGVNGAMFADTEGHWAEAYIDALTMEGVINGMGEGSFQPDSLVTREQFLKMLSIVASKTMDERLAFEKPPVLNKIIEKPVFSDVPVDRWSYYYVKEAVDKIIFASEYGENLNPVADITREEAAVWMARALSLPSGYADFTDNGEIKNPELVGAAFENGLITGFPDGSFGPNKPLTRAQASVMLKRAGDLNARLIENELTTEEKAYEIDLDGNGEKESIKVLSDGERYMVKVDELGAIGGYTTPEETRYYTIDIDKTDDFTEFAVSESFYGAGALAIYRYTGETLYLMGYIESMGGVEITEDNILGDKWGAICINGDGTISANIGEQFVHTMLLRKQFNTDERGRLVSESPEYYTVGSYSEFTVAKGLESPKSDDEHEGISLKAGHAGKIVKTDLKNWLYIETGSGINGWIYVHDDYLIDGEPLSYYLEGLYFAG